MPSDPPRAFLDFQSASNLFCRIKIHLKKCGNYGPPFQISRYATALKCFCDAVILFKKQDRKGGRWLYEFLKKGREP